MEAVTSPWRRRGLIFARLYAHTFSFSVPQNCPVTAVNARLYPVLRLTLLLAARVSVVSTLPPACATDLRPGPLGEALRLAVTPAALTRVLVRGGAGAARPKPPRAIKAAPRGGSQTEALQMPFRMLRGEVCILAQSKPRAPAGERRWEGRVATRQTERRPIRRATASDPEAGSHHS